MTQTTSTSSTKANMAVARPILAFSVTAAMSRCAQSARTSVCRRRGLPLVFLNRGSLSTREATIDLLIQSAGRACSSSIGPSAWRFRMVRQTRWQATTIATQARPSTAAASTSVSQWYPR